jgi:uncharacterized LabA/DUF88 family protein
MIFYQEERIAMFIDGANLYAAARALGFDIDYKRLLDLFASKGRLFALFIILHWLRIKSIRRFARSSIGLITMVTQW